MVKQYGNWIYVNEDPTNDDGVKALLTDNMNHSARAAIMDFSQGKAEYIFKQITDHMKLFLGLDPGKEWWSAAWKVTL